MALEWSKNGVFWVRFGHSVVLLMRGKACAGAGEEQGRNGSFGGRTVGVFVIAMPWLYSAGIDEQNGGFFMFSRFLAGKVDIRHCAVKRLYLRHQRNIKNEVIKILKN